jgi:hypothetical protein
MEKQFSDATKDAAAIAAEVVALRYAAGWFDDMRVAVATKAELAPFDIGTR